jgi:hypothetical protein
MQIFDFTHLALFRYADISLAKVMVLGTVWCAIRVYDHKVLGKSQIHHPVSSIKHFEGLCFYDIIWLPDINASDLGCPDWQHHNETWKQTPKVSFPQWGRCIVFHHTHDERFPR